MEIKTRWGFNHVSFSRVEIFARIPTLLEVEGV
jgi:hypothetical protein